MESRQCFGAQSTIFRQTTQQCPGVKRQSTYSSGLRRKMGFKSKRLQDARADEIVPLSTLGGVPNGVCSMANKNQTTTGNGSKCYSSKLLRPGSTGKSPRVRLTPNLTFNFTRFDWPTARIFARQRHAVFGRVRGGVRLGPGRGATWEPNEADV